ncbi:hypothetical protein DAERI_170038 [Deinococcus aerius]|uniref:Peptidase MA-like domain-containing protein n=1 Tax=Deinococcus aerius TaxID=200253 RepID=A0A2I9CZV3_9DEIO|nr:nuclear transport factor 2 family protein [Deinococcus aerius]GBF07779.1 hypothetical protein DAERI_170038 [Deinococcus aerius]
MTPRAALFVGLTLLCPAALAQRTPQELAGALQKAARAGDASAYRALLAPSGTFTVEGANFAADLTRRPPGDVTYSFSDIRPQGSGAEANLTLVWTRVPEGGSPAEGEVSRVTLPVGLVRVGDLWRYAGEAFEPIRTGTGTLLALKVPGLPERVAPLAPLLARAAQEVRNVLSLTVPADAVVKVYPDAPRLSASVYLSLPPVAGWNEPGEAIKFVLPEGPPAEVERATLRVLTHEFTHLAVGLAAGQGRDKRIPWWLHEGLANFAARAFVSAPGWQAWQSRANAYARSGWVPLTELADFPSVPEARWDNAYRQGLGVVEFLAGTRGKEGPWRLAQAFAETGNADAAARSADFPSFAALETAARSWLAAR